MSNVPALEDSTQNNVLRSTCSDRGHAQLRRGAVPPQQRSSGGAGDSSQQLIGGDPRPSAAVGAGWSVTPGHLAFLDSKVSSFDPWLRVGLAVLMGLLTIASLFATSAASRALSDEPVWQVRAIGFGVMAITPWLTYHAYDYVCFGFIPMPLITAVAAAIGLGMVLLPRHAAISLLLPPADKRNAAFLERTASD